MSTCLFAIPNARIATFFHSRAATCQQHFGAATSTGFWPTSPGNVSACWKIPLKLFWPRSILAVALHRKPRILSSRSYSLKSYGFFPKKFRIPKSRPRRTPSHWAKNCFPLGGVVVSTASAWAYRASMPISSTTWGGVITLGHTKPSFKKSATQGSRIIARILSPVFLGKNQKARSATLALPFLRGQNTFRSTSSPWSREPNFRNKLHSGKSSHLTKRHNLLLCAKSRLGSKSRAWCNTKFRTSPKGAMPLSTTAFTGLSGLI